MVENPLGYRRKSSPRRLFFYEKTHMFPIASSTALITDTASDIGVGLLAVLGIVLAAWAGLVALGYFTRKTTKKVTGHKY